MPAELHREAGTPADARTPALRSRLLLAMIAPMAGVAIVLALIGAVIVTRVVRTGNDRVLGGALAAIAESVQVEHGKLLLFPLHPAALAMLETPQGDTVYYRLALGARTLSGHRDLPAPEDIAALPRSEPAFRYVTYQGLRLRLAEMRRPLPGLSTPVLVQVGETLGHRQALRHRLIAALVLGEAVLVGLAVLLLRPALSWSLRPLARLRDAVARRKAHGAPDLSPLDAGPLPRELRPLAEAFDSLLARLDTATAGIRRFTADASHQMRTPLSALKVQVALARRGDARALAAIADATERLEHLMTQLLVLARAEEAGVPTARERVNLREVAIAVVNRHIGQAIDAGIDLVLEAPQAGAVCVSGYRTLVFEILANLIDNAIRYGARDGSGTITVAITAPGTISVRDTGPGLSETDLARLGARFVRLESSVGTRGSGLGFAIVRSAARRMEAQVEVANAHPGLCVTLIFPEGS
ncbi:MAG: sensor histidine kinase N-terminal domain-containing protein [Pseudomonadota bacterium]|nr:sensor histidine kinase N-terminal domain-containing protein [Pseudomonadota bacterium]